jgi:lipopolysaccharide/colanic/teichoic acid biosynthesis glycosyltransferase
MIKRAFDLVFAALVLAVCGPVLLVIGVLVKILSKGPVFFRDQRAGFQSRPFALLKFRTMRDERDANGNLLPDERRLAPFGRFLRSTSLDELPELINVLKGEMSIVGPRPLHFRYVTRYTPEQSRRHEVKPGLTGWAQVNGRNALTWEEKFRLDVWYVDHWSLWLDLRILASTLYEVIRGRGISQPGHATMPEFMGTAEAKENR